MTGRLKGTLFGRPVELDATGREVVLRIANLRSAWRLRHSAKTSLLPILRALRHAGIELRLQIGSRFIVQILPTPNIALRLLLPGLPPPSSGEKA